MEKICQISVVRVIAMVELPEKIINRHAVYVPENYEDELFKIEGVSSVELTIAGTIIIEIDEPKHHHKIMNKCQKIINGLLAKMKD